MIAEPTALHDWLPVSMRVVLFAATFLLQSTLLIAVGLCASRWTRGRGPAIQSVILRTALVAVLGAPLASLGLAAAGIDALSISSLQPWMPKFQGSSAALPEPATPSSPAAAIVGVDRDVAPPVDVTRTAYSAVPERPADTGSAPSLTASAFVYVMLVIVWAAGSTLLLVRLLICHVQISRWRRSARRAGPDLVADCRRLAGRLGIDPPAVRISSRAATPCLVGFYRPMILLPETDDTNPARHEVILHELAHLARRDCLWGLVCRGATAVFFFQPLLWVLSRRIERVGEHVADDVVLRHTTDRRSYARLLVRIAERFGPTRAEAVAGITVV